MIVLPQKVKIKWSPFGRKFYEPNGYIFTKYYEEFEVDVLDLPDGSNVFIDVVCDYCGEVFNKKYSHYTDMKKKNKITKDCCSNCTSEKTRESNMITYGGSPSSNYNVQEKLKRTNLNRYGVEYCSQNKDVQNKTKQTSMDRYGVNHYSKTDECKEKYVNTCQERYGFDNTFQVEEFKEKSKETCLALYGFEKAIQNPEIKAKAVKTLYENGTCPTSSQQLDIYNMLNDFGYNVELNYPLSRINMDVAILLMI